MGFSRGEELCTVVDWSPPACPTLRIKLGYYWLVLSVWQGDWLDLENWSPPACCLRIEWADCWSVDSLGSDYMSPRLETEIPNSPDYPSPRCLAAPAESIAGSKRRLSETSSCQNVERLFCSSHSEGSSKKLRQLDHQTHHNWHVACSSDSGTRWSRLNSVSGKDCDNLKTSVWKSCVGNSEYLRFRTNMRMRSDPDCLLRCGGWSISLASTNVRTLLAVLGLCPKCCFRVTEQFVSREASPVESIRNEATSIGWDFEVNDIGEHFDELPRVQSVPLETISVGVNSKEPTPTTWECLPNDLQANVFQRVAFRDIFLFKIVSKSWKKFLEGKAFRQSLGGTSQGEFTAINYYIKNESWRCSGYDLHSKSWRPLPQLSYLPPPNEELFKEYSVSGHGGFMCAEVSKLPKKGELVVFNPFTGETRALPPLLHPRNPVLVHLSIDSDKKSYKVIVAGSSAASDEHLSKKVEVFDSSTSKWKKVSDLRGPAFGLNEHQAGVCLNGILFFISFLESDCRRGVVAFDLQEEKWLQSLTTPIPWSSYSNTLQLVESDGKLFLFSERESDQSVDHCIHELEFPDPKAGTLTCRWRSAVKVKKSEGPGLQVYPDHTCDGSRNCSPLSWKKIYFLLASCNAIMMPSGAFAWNPSMDSLSGMWNSSNAGESAEFAKAAAGTLLAGLMMIGAAGVAWGIFHRRQAPGNRFDIMRGLEVSDRPGNREQLREILPAIPA